MKKLIALPLLALCLSSCEKKEIVVAPKPSATAVDSFPTAELVGRWRVDFVSGAPELEGGTIEFTADQEMKASDKTGKRDTGPSEKHKSFWHLLRLSGGDFVIATESTFSVEEDYSRSIQDFAMPYVLKIVGDTMTWSLLTRDGFRPVRPSSEVAYRFSRIKD